MSFIFTFSDNSKGFKPLIPWATIMHGARQMLNCLQDRHELDLAPGIHKSKGKDIYHKAIFDWLLEDLNHIEEYLAGTPLKFYNHQKDSKGKLIKCSVKIDDKF